MCLYLPIRKRRFVFSLLGKTWSTYVHHACLDGKSLLIPNIDIFVPIHDYWFKSYLFFSILKKSSLSFEYAPGNSYSVLNNSIFCSFSVSIIIYEMIHSARRNPHWHCENYNTKTRRTHKVHEDTQCSSSYN